MNQHNRMSALPVALLMSFIVVLTLLPDVSYAALGGGFGAAPWERALQTLVDLLTGSTARLVAIIAVASIGYMTFAKGMIPWGWGISVIIAIAIIFGAATIVDMFAS